MALSFAQAMPAQAQLFKFLHRPPATQAGAAPIVDAAVAPGQFDFYVLSLSWSSGFCDTSPSGNGRDQCAVGAHLGFVVHGLWPQNEHGFPSNCQQGTYVPRAALDSVKDLYPSTGLARYEWRKHGTCTGLSASAYFASVAAARQSVQIPPQFQAPQQAQTMSPVEVMRAFTAVNPLLRPGMLAVECRKGELTEVRICLTKDLHAFRACGEVARRACHAASINIAAER
ncbi:MAG: ribonuclease T [Hyphomicrobiales bacterium]|nr:ribonuclease T [Hyphomicrobiales bacterium]MDE2113618.1 ribonuclease T [Hyphomicrobiales bacterium]